MSVLRNVWADLVEKRLWPLAVVLALALVAVPIVLARTGGSAPGPAPLPPAPPAAPAAGTPATQPVAKPIKVVDPTAKAAPRGHYHDPFAASAAPTTTTSSSGGAGAGAPSGSAAGSSPKPASPSSPASPSPSGGSSTPSAPVTPVGPPQPVKPQPATLSGYFAGYRLDVGFGPAGAVRPSKDIVRLKMLGPAGKTPLLIFLGFRTDGKTAMFLLDGESTPTGDGACWPTAKACQVLALRKGDSEFFDVPEGVSGVVQYELDVNRVSQRRSPSHKLALLLRRRESKAGRKEMFAVIASGRTLVTHLVYASIRGVLVTRPRTGTSGTPKA